MYIIYTIYQWLDYIQLYFSVNMEFAFQFGFCSVHVKAQHGIFGSNIFFLCVFVWNNEIWLANITENYGKTLRFSWTILAKTFIYILQSFTQLQSQFELKLDSIVCKLKMKLHVHSRFFSSSFLVTHLSSCRVFFALLFFAFRIYFGLFCSDKTNDFCRLFDKLSPLLLI